MLIKPIILHILILQINLVKRNGLIIFDNVLWHGDVAKKNVTDNQTELIRKFNMYIKNDKKN